MGCSSAKQQATDSALAATEVCGSEVWGSATEGLPQPNESAPVEQARPVVLLGSRPFPGHTTAEEYYKSLPESKRQVGPPAFATLFSAGLVSSKDEAPDRSCMQW